MVAVFVASAKLSNPDLKASSSFAFLLNRKSNASKAILAIANVPRNLLNTAAKLLIVAAAMLAAPLTAAKPPRNNPSFSVFNPESSSLLAAIVPTVEAVSPTLPTKLAAAACLRALSSLTCAASAAEPNLGGASRLAFAAATPVIYFSLAACASLIARANCLYCAATLVCLLPKASNTAKSFWSILNISGLRRIV